MSVCVCVSDLVCISNGPLPVLSCLTLVAVDDSQWKKLLNLIIARGQVGVKGAPEYLRQ